MRTFTVGTGVQVNTNTVQVNIIMVIIKTRCHVMEIINAYYSNYNASFFHLSN